MSSPYVGAPVAEFIFVPVENERRVERRLGEKCRSTLRRSEGIRRHGVTGWTDAQLLY
jgi:hypothetical protein